MKKKKLLIGLIVLLIILTPLIVTAAKDLIMYDEQGRVIVRAGEEKPDIPAGTPTALVIHNETESEKEAKKEKETQNALAEKEAFEANAQLSTASQVELEPITTEEKAQMDNVILAEHNYEDEAKVVLKKYYGNSKIEKLFKQLKAETSKSTSGSLLNDYTIPDVGIELIDLMFDMIDGDKATSDEKETIKNYLKTIEPLGIRNNEELKIKLEDLE